jgi:multicomponent Na+:H+ antiporter subunit C
LTQKSRERYMPDTILIMLISAAAVMLTGIFGILTRSNIVKILLSINIFQTGVNLLLVGLGYVPGGKAPLITPEVSSSILMVDPLPQAMVLTSIVIGFGTTALGLFVAIRYYNSNKSLEINALLSQETKEEA